MEELYYKFDCGCRLKQFSSEKKSIDNLPPMEIDYYNLRDCSKAWDLIGTGRTKGIFQLESGLGQQWSAKLEPWNIEELSALISLMRPGCLRAIVDGKSMTQHYVDRKHGREPNTYLHPSLEVVLESTWGVLTYQEQAMRIAQELAGFTESEADVLRKAIGKKKPEIMAKVKKTFLEGCEKAQIVNVAEAEEIFGWIQESQKYSFNKSHGVGYSTIGYWSAYAKSHVPLHFFTSCLYYAKEKADTFEEISELVSDAKSFGINVSGPKISTVYSGNHGEFGLTLDGIHFGIQNVKRIGRNHTIKFIDTIKQLEGTLGRKISEWTWEEFLILYSNNTTTTVINNLISVGCMDQFKKSRKSMIYEYDVWKKLTSREQNCLVENIDKFGSLADALQFLSKTDRKLGGPSTDKRREIVKDLLLTVNNPPSSLSDHPLWITNTEKDLMGISLSCTALDSCDVSRANTSCIDIINGKNSNNYILGVEIKGVNEVTIRNGPSKGKKMAFVNVEDGTTRLNSLMCFADNWESSKHLIYEGNTVLLFCNKSNKKDSLIINKVRPI